MPMVAYRGARIKGSLAHSPILTKKSTRCTLRRLRKSRTTELRKQSEMMLCAGSMLSRSLPSQHQNLVSWPEDSTASAIMETSSPIPIATSESCPVTPQLASLTPLTVTTLAARSASMTQDLGAGHLPQGQGRPRYEVEIRGMYVPVGRLVASSHVRAEGCFADGAARYSAAGRNCQSPIFSSGHRSPVTCGFLRKTVPPNPWSRVWPGCPRATTLRKVRLRRR